MTFLAPCRYLELLRELVTSGVNQLPSHYVNNDMISSNKKDIANMFNNYFTNIGPDKTCSYTTT